MTIQLGTRLDEKSDTDYPLEIFVFCADTVFIFV